MLWPLHKIYFFELQHASKREPEGHFTVHKSSRISNSQLYLQMSDGPLGFVLQKRSSTLCY